jgi:hypothetical protein
MLEGSTTHHLEQAIPDAEQRGAVSMPLLSRALLLYSRTLSSDDRNVTRLLEFFGIPWKAVTIEEISRNGALAANVDSSKFCVLSSASCMAEAIQGIDDCSNPMPAWMTEASSVYIWGFQDTDPCNKLLRLLSSDPGSSTHNLEPPHSVMSITGHFPEMCGPMSELRIPIESSAEDRVFEVQRRTEQYQSIVSTNDGDAFCGVTYRGVRFYLNPCCKTIDINSATAKYFDVKRWFSSAVPITMYLRWAFANVCWTGTETSACLIVDDPPLTPRYGFLHFSEALELMDKHGFTTTIAFIPWNWKRTHSRAVTVIQQSPERFSLAIHGCDHTAGEFAARSSALLNRRIRTASRRMELLFQRTSLPHDRVMVFPQGAFSPETGRALKLNGFVAATNTEVAPFDDACNTTTIADLWQVAIMKYGSFPIFTRRYVTHGLENFAFDALLGKPCLIVGHHDIFKDHGRDLVDFIAKLNSLKWKLCWRPLGEAISHSFKACRLAGGKSLIQMYANTLVIENRSTDACEAVVLKEESDPDGVQAVTVNQKGVDYDYERKSLCFRVKVAPKETAHVRVLYFDKLDISSSKDGIGYDINTRARRYLSELRDNYLSQSEFLHAGAIKLRGLLK